MKHFFLLIFAAVLAVAAPVPSAQANVDVSIDFFYDALSPHGDWIYADDYGYVFQPALARQGDWAPYSDGYWAYTDAGWTWISNEDFGWATYHYGRWIQMEGTWVWVPGTEWAPAWVSWRQTDDHIGWAPLPPEARWSVNVGFNQWTDSYYDIGPSWYNFVPFNLFARRSSLRPVIINRSRNITYINNSVNVTNITYRQNVVNNIFVGGPDPDRFDRGDNRIRRLSLRRDDDRFRREWMDNRGERPRDFDSLSRIEQNELVVAAPSVRRDENPGLPPRVRERFESPEINRGWRDAGDSKEAEALRERQRAELAKAKPAELPEKRPFIATSKVPPPAVGRVLKPEERRGSRQRPDPSLVDEEVRRATPGAPDRPGTAERPGTAGRPEARDTPPGPGDASRPGMTERREGDRPERTPGSRVPEVTPGDRPSDMPPGRQPGSKGNAKGDSKDDAKGERRPGVKPEEAPRPRLAPGVVPGDEDRRRGGVPPSSTTPPKTQNEPPAARPEPGRKTPVPSKDRPEMPRVNPSAPGDRESRIPESRRPSSIPSAPAARPVPMPEPKDIPKARPSPMPEPKAVPKTRPVPMPEPKVRPSPAKKPESNRDQDNDRRKSAPDIRSVKPASPERIAPQPKPSPQVKKSAPQPRPQVKQSPPQVKKAAPKPTPKARPAPSKKKPSAAKKDEDRKER